MPTASRQTDHRDRRRRSELITPVPKPQEAAAARRGQTELVFGGGDGLSTDEQEYNPTPIINEIRSYVEAWRKLPNPDQWQVTPETARLLQHWRHHQLQRHPAVLLPDRGGRDGDLADRGRARSWARAAPSSGSISAAPTTQANPELLRLALKLATGAGKTTVMAMLIAWQTVNAVRHPSSKHFTRGFLVVTPGHHDQGPPARAPAQRSGQLLSRAANWFPPTCSATSSAPRSSSPTTTPSSCASGWRSPRAAARCSQGRGEELEHARNRRPDAPARHARPDGHEEHPRAQRRGAPLLPREAARRRDEDDLKGDEKEEAEEEQRGRAAVDLRPRNRQAQARRRARLSTCRRRRSSCAARATPRARCSPGR